MMNGIEKISCKSCASCRKQLMADASGCGQRATADSGREAPEATGNASPNMATFGDWKIHQPKVSGRG
jgi:hypothetical protein